MENKPLINIKATDIVEHHRSKQTVLTMTDLPDYQKSLGLSQKQLSLAMGVSQLFVARIERDIAENRSLMIPTLQRYAQAMVTGDIRLDRADARVSPPFIPFLEFPSVILSPLPCY